FIGRLYGLKGSTLKQQVNKMVDLCGLEREQNKKIEMLSKGYRQRVGLAQSLIHDPKVLVLDEPTTGLDPNQIIEIRSLIKNISREKTVIFSSHIMQEVEALCDRVIVINKGKLIADDKVGNLQLNDRSLKIHAEFSHDIDFTLFHALEAIDKIEKASLGKVIFHIKDKKDIRSEIFALASEHKLPLIGLKLEEMSMEGIFRELTKEQETT
ncbi:MAG: ATP-binding cassette domain-containing protein, partial [Cyclobacteriaceae bacterium]|nr:ATP-binding cassette domain-containing protein [Cyclobacteriaceae bacterium]